MKIAHAELYTTSNIVCNFEFSTCNTVVHRIISVDNNNSEKITSFTARVIPVYTPPLHFVVGGGGVYKEKKKILSDVTDHIFHMCQVRGKKSPKIKFPHNLVSKRIKSLLVSTIAD